LYVIHDNESAWGDLLFYLNIHHESLTYDYQIKTKAHKKRNSNVQDELSLFEKPIGRID
jgi:hypothetical protein